jgi:sigma-B regulation protein RsbU (phosphoserine phosphatase)
LYDYFAMRDGRLCIAIGDVSDKGIPAALFMAVTRTLIRTVAEDEDDPARIVAKVNEKLAENNRRLMFVTLMLATIDPASRLVRWVSAGHPPSIHCASGTQARALSGRSGPACGVQGDLRYRSFSTQLRAGDVLLGYTDGVTEAMAPDSRQYGESRLFACLERLGPIDCAPLLEGILADVKAHAAGAEQSDDITLIAVRIP